MLHTKFHGNRSTGSGEEDFKGFLPYMSVAAHLVMFMDFHFLLDEGLHTKFG